MENLRRYEETAMLAARSGAGNHMTITSDRGNGYKGQGQNADGERYISMDGKDLSVLAAGEDLKFNSPQYPHEMFGEYTNTTKTKFLAALILHRPY